METQKLKHLQIVHKMPLLSSLFDVFRHKKTVYSKKQVNGKNFLKKYVTFLCLCNCI